MRHLSPALLAHDDAFNKAGVLHRDISVGNIMITEGNGMLIDWDLSKRVDKSPNSCDQALLTDYILTLMST